MTPTISAVYHRTTGLWVKRHYALLQFTDGRTFVTPLGEPWDHEPTLAEVVSETARLVGLLQAESAL
jgi:hypothetical protein